MEIEFTFGKRPAELQWLLKWTYGLSFLAIGLDKVLQLDWIAAWGAYVPNWLVAMLPVSESLFLLSAGIAEVILALLILTRWAREGAYLSALWLLLISGTLVTLRIYDVVVRDVVMAVGAFVLARLSEREP